MLKDYTVCSERNDAYERGVIQTASGVRLVHLKICSTELLGTRLVLYMYVNDHNGKCYIGRPGQPAGDRFLKGARYRLQEAMRNAIVKHYGDGSSTVKALETMPHHPINSDLAFKDS